MSDEEKQRMLEEKAAEIQKMVAEEQRIKELEEKKNAGFITKLVNKVGENLRDKNFFKFKQIGFSSAGEYDDGDEPEIPQPFNHPLMKKVELESYSSDEDDLEVEEKDYQECSFEGKVDADFEKEEKEIHQKEKEIDENEDDLLAMFEMEAMEDLEKDEKGEGDYKYLEESKKEVNKNKKEKKKPEKPNNPPPPSSLFFNQENRLNLRRKNSRLLMEKMLKNENNNNYYRLNLPLPKVPTGKKKEHISPRMIKKNYRKQNSLSSFEKKNFNNNKKNGVPELPKNKPPRKHSGNFKRDSGMKNFRRKTRSNSVTLKTKRTTIKRVSNYSKQPDTKELERFNQTKQIICGSSKRDCCEIVSFSRPPKVILDLVSSSLLLLGKNQKQIYDWEFCKNHVRSQEILKEIKLFHPKPFSNYNIFEKNFKKIEVDKVRSSCDFAIYLYNFLESSIKVINSMKV